MIAAEVYDRHKSEIHTVALVNTGALDLGASTDDTSLAGVVTSENRYALAYASITTMVILMLEDF